MRFAVGSNKYVKPPKKPYMDVSLQGILKIRNDISYKELFAWNQYSNGSIYVWCEVIICDINAI